MSSETTIHVCGFNDLFLTIALHLTSAIAATTALGVIHDELSIAGIDAKGRSAPACPGCEPANGAKIPARPPTIMRIPPSHVLNKHVWKPTSTAIIDSISHKP